MSNITVRDNHIISVIQPEIIDVQFTEVPEVPSNPTKSSGDGAPKEKIKYEYDGGKIARGIFDDFVDKWVDKFLDLFMKK